MGNKIKRNLQKLMCFILVSVMLSGCGLPEEVTDKVFAGFAGAFAEPESNPSVTDKMIETTDYAGVPGYTGPAETTNAEDEVDETREEPVVAEGMAAQTIMIYLVGSDLESEHGSATLDLKEIMEAGVDTEHNNVVVYTGGASEWKLEGLSADENSILLLNAEQEFTVIDSTVSKNMGEAGTLSSFINYCFDNFNSATYSLILWNHGAGPVYGFGIDENYRDLLTMEEMEEAFEDSVGASGQNLEWIGFDACLMNSLEMADLLAPYANYMIASQETEPGWGWDYEFLSELSDEVLTGDEMGKLIIDYYMQYGQDIYDASPRFYCDLTLSCIDLNKYQAAEDALDRCFSELDEELTVDTYPELVRNREHTKDFGTYATNFDYGMVDAVHLLKQIAPESETATDAIEAIENMVVYSQSNMRNANGISICYPYSADDVYTSNCITVQENIEFSPAYTGFLQKFYSIQNGEQIVSEWDFAEAETSATTIESESVVNVDVSDISLQLTEEQQANFATADFFILNKITEEDVSAEQYPRVDEMYMFVHLGKDVTLDENGVLHGYYGNQVLYAYDMTTEEYSPMPLLLREEERTEEEVRYVCGAVLSNWAMAELEDWTSESAWLQIVVSDEYPDGIIRSAVPINEDGEVSPSKQLLDLEDFSYMEIFSRGSYLTRGENGEMLNFYSWEESGLLLGFGVDLQNEYCLEMRPLEDPENYVCMFRIKDAQGNVSYSELIPLQ
ncbi:MAG: hypothetical protein IJX66_00755 [Lachnospiraceae bacterium]|nr:hypothetical protein [Lachnospiraceae bacterium]